MSIDNKSISTLVAVATPAGEGGIAVVRLSGDNAKQIALKVIEYKKGFDEPNKLVKSSLYGKLCDEVMGVWFKKPNSYTGEEVFEIHCHGNNLIAEYIVTECINNGCRLAQAGEFTKRAFLNGKIDLTSAEGIIDIINAQTTSQVNAAFQFVKGELYKKIESIQKQIITLTAQAEVSIDYPEEDLESASKSFINERLDSIINELETLLNTYESGRLIKDGVHIAIVGAPNVGKSQLLNTLLRRDRAIVTAIAGTTRDTLCEAFSYKGIKFVLTDTAGIRTTIDEVEKIGIDKSLQAIKQSDIILALYDQNTAFNVDLPPNKPVIYVKNKLDLASQSTQNLHPNYTSNSADFSNINDDKNSVFISALTGKNIDILLDKIYNKTIGKISGAGVQICNMRQYNAVKAALTALERAKQQLYVNTLDIIICDLNYAYRDLGSVTGLVASEEIVGEIFAKFCVGK